MLPYLLKSGACLSLFFVFYKFFLENENMHVFKRFYLLVSLLAAFSIPFITFTSYISVAPIEEFQLLNQAITTDTSVEQPSHTPNYFPLILWTIYGVGVLFFGIKFLYNISSLVYKIQRNPKHKTNSYIHVLLNDIVSPHTFFNYIFFNKYKFESKQIPREVFLHEQTHAKQKHSIDIILIEGLQVIFWFNPFIYLIKKAIKLNHEFLADQAVLNNGYCLTTYQKMLLSFSSKSNQPDFANALNYSLIKKRFTIMKTSTTAKSAWLRSLVILPMLSILIYSFSEKVTVEKMVPQGQEELASFQKTSMSEGSKDEFKKSNQISLLKKQDGATKEQLAEYNKIAKHYNAMSKTNMIIKNSEVKRMHYIYYKLMNDAQRKEVEPYPSIPPPPPAKNGANKVVGTFAPPPPPIPANATPAQKKKYQIAIENYKRNLANSTQTKSGKTVEGKLSIPPPPPPAVTNETLAKGSEKLQKVFKKFSEQSKLYIQAIKQYKETGENYNQVSTNYKKVLEYHQDYKELAVIEGILPSPPPPPILPPNPTDHMIEMAKKGAVFYYEDKKITTDKAIAISKKNKDINIQILGHESSMPIVKLSKKPIVLKKKPKK